MKRLLRLTIILIVIFILAGCERKVTIMAGVTSSKTSDLSYTVVWEGKKLDLAGLHLLILSDYTNESSPFKGQRMAGNSLNPISGYHDRDGEIVSFSDTNFGNLLILDRYFPHSARPSIFYVFRDENGILDVKPLSTNSGIFRGAFSEIATHQ